MPRAVIIDDSIITARFSFVRFSGDIKKDGVGVSRRVSAFPSLASDGESASVVADELGNYRLIVSAKQTAHYHIIGVGDAGEADDIYGQVVGIPERPLE